MKNNSITATCCRLLVWLIPFLFFISQSNAQQIAKSLTAKNSQLVGFYEYKPVNYSNDKTKKYPLIIFLHGMGERGNGTTDLGKILWQGIPRLINEGSTMTFKGETFLVLSPQLSMSKYDWENFYVDEMLEYAYKNLQVDRDRVYLTGLSLGGGGVWRYANESLDNAKKFAAIVPICGVCTYNTNTLKSTIGSAFLGVWGFLNADDNVVWPGCTYQAFNTIGISGIVKLTVYPSGGHNSWDKAYDMGNSVQSPNVYEWMLSFSRALTLLPLKLNDFNISRVPSGINIKWKSDAEEKSGYYEVERSSDGKNFASVYKVNTTGSASSYQYIDYKSFQGNVYYRIRMVDKLGKFQYSAVKQATTETESLYTVTVYDKVGRLIIKRKLTNVNAILSEIKGKGIYFMNINDGKTETTRKLNIL
jgi:hypothetical protein